MTIRDNEVLELVSDPALTDFVFVYPAAGFSAPGGDEALSEQAAASNLYGRYSLENLKRILAPDLTSVETGATIVSKLEALASGSRLSYNRLDDRPTIPTLRTAAQTRELLETLTGNDRLPASAIRGAASSFPDLSDTPGALGSAGQFIRVNAAGNALEFISDAFLTPDIVSDASLSGNGSSGSPLGVTNPFTTADEAKLDGIESNATADQTGSEIVSLLSGLTGAARLPATAISGLTQGQILTFAALTDTPSSLGNAGQVPAVNAGGTALEFVDASAAAARNITEYIYRRTATSTAPTINIPTATRWVFGTIPTSVEDPLEGANPTAAQLQAALDSNDVEEITGRVQYLNNSNQVPTDLTTVTRVGFDWDGSRHSDDHEIFNLFLATTANIDARSIWNFRISEYSQTSFGGTSRFLDATLSLHKQIADADGTVWNVWGVNFDVSRPTQFILSDARSIVLNTSAAVRYQHYSTFAAAAAAVAPNDVAAASVQMDGYIPTDWTAVPTGVTDSLSYEWVAARRGKAGTYGNFSTPAILERIGGSDTGTDTGTQIVSKLEALASGSRLSYTALDDTPTAETGASIVSKLRTLTGNARLPATAVRDLPTGDNTFIALTDTPTSFASQAGKYLAVNSASNALEFVDAPSGGAAETGATIVSKLTALTGQARLPASAIRDGLFRSLTDTPTGYVPGHFLRANSTGRALEYTPPPTFLSLTDTPPIYSTAGQFVRINDANNGLTFSAVREFSLADESKLRGIAVNATRDTGATIVSKLSGLTGNARLPATAIRGLSQEQVSSFTSLSDTPSSLGTTGQIPAVNAAGTALEFIDAPTGGGGATEITTYEPVFTEVAITSATANFASSEHNAQLENGTTVFSYTVPSSVAPSATQDTDASIHADLTIQIQGIPNNFNRSYGDFSLVHIRGSNRTVIARDANYIRVRTTGAFTLGSFALDSIAGLRTGDRLEIVSRSWSDRANQSFALYTTNAPAHLTIESFIERQTSISGGGGGGGGASTFAALTDTPSSLGNAGQIPAVNAAGTALEFINAPESEVTQLASTDTILTLDASFRPYGLATSPNKFIAVRLNVVDSAANQNDQLVLLRTFSTTVTGGSFVAVSSTSQQLVRRIDARYVSTTDKRLELRIFPTVFVGNFNRVEVRGMWQF